MATGHRQDGSESDGSDHPQTGNPADEVMSWSFRDTAAGPRLAYGEPRTDNVRLSLRCPPSSGGVVLSFIRPPSIANNRPARATVVSGNTQRSVEVAREDGQLGTSVNIELPTSTAPLQGFRQGQRLEIRWGGETIAVPGSANGPVADFFRACG